MTGIYVRVSTQEQAKEGYSIGEQKERLSQYASAMGWTVHDCYVDAGFSGSSTDRPSLQRLIDDVESGIIDRVLVYKLDRLSRSQKDTLHLIEDVFLANDCAFVSMSENFDTATPFGKAMIGILAVFAQLEREQIKERLMMGKDARARQGGYVGKIPIGYDYDVKTQSLVVNDYEAMQIKRIFDMYLSGMTINAIEKSLEGIKHKYGIWRYSTLRKMLRSRIYLGEIHWHGEWYKSTHTPLITEDMHTRAVMRLDKTKDSYNSTREGSVRSLLGGIIYCERCGAKYSKIIFDNHINRYVKYSCNSRHKHQRSLIKDPSCMNKNWDMEALDNLVLDEIRKLKLEQTEPQKKKDYTKQTAKEIARIEKQIDRLVDLYSVGDIPKSTLEKKIAEHNAEKAKLTHILSQERKNTDLRREKEKLVNSIDEIINNGTMDDLRLLVTTLIDHVGIDGDDVTIYWNL